MTERWQHRRPLIYLITDRAKLAGNRPNASLTCLVDFIAKAIKAGVDMVQIREPDLSTRDLYRLLETALELAQSSSTRILVNDRADLAAACPGAGVHLTTRSLTAEIVRQSFGRELLVGASTHSLDELRSAEKGRADFAVFGPVFETESKRQYGPPVGLNALRVAIESVSIPVLALGGVGLNNFREPLDCGATGIAGISLFAECDDLQHLVKTVKGKSIAS